MPTELLKDQIKGLISKDQADKALAQLLDFCKQNEDLKDIERTALINSGQLERLENERNKDRLTAEEYALKKNKILSSLLSLIDSLESVPETFTPASLATVPTTPSSTSPTSVPQNSSPSLHDNIFISVVLLLFIASVVALFYFTFQAHYGQSGIFFSSASGTCLVYLNWRKKATFISTPV